MKEFTKVIYFLTSICILLLTITKNEWEATGKIENSIYNPYDFWVLGDDLLLVNDLGFKSSPIGLINFKEDDIVSNLRTGQGPGEVTSTFYKRVTKYTNGDFLLWDAGSNRIMRYNDSLQYITDIRASGFGRRFIQAGLINDSTLLTMENSPNFLSAWRIKDNTINESEMLWSISIDEYEELTALKNFVLMQTIYFGNYDGALYLTFEFSSLLIAIDENGVKYIQKEPENIPLPVHDEKSGGYGLPIMGKHPEGARDIALDDNYVYITFSGKKISRWEQMRYAFNFEELIEKIKHSQRLLIFDRETGNFVKEIELPKTAMKFKIFGNSAYLLNTIDDVPSIYKYSFNLE